MPRLILIPLLALAACAAEPDATADATASDDIDTPEAVQPTSPDGSVIVGDAVPDGEALSVDELIAQAADLDGKTVTVEGTVREVCQMEGCWLTLADAEGRTVRIAVPRGDDGYDFTFPKSASGQEARIFGPLAVEEESVESQRHYAEDGGATPDELAAITEPKRTVTLTALGARLADAGDAS
jgi:hypothetical protein